MILKEKQFTNPTDPKLKAGEEAEKQMAFYLKRTFEKDKNCFVINNLRINHNDNIAQIDHLIVTQYGLFIIESKSGNVSVNKHNEWTRTFANKTEGMASPILQAERQGEVLKELITENKEKLLDKMLFGRIQKGFKYCPIFVYVAISDSGLPPERGVNVPELQKADRVGKLIKENLNSFLSALRMDISWSMTIEEAEKVAKFLLEKHTPTIKNQTIPQTVTKNKSLVTSSKTTAEMTTEKSFIPKAGAICPQCKKHKLIRKSISRSDGTETDFLACEAYPSACKAIFALVAMAKNLAEAETKTNIKSLKENDECPKCKIGKLVKRKAKTEFLGCSQYPKCKFTDYK